MNIDLVGILRNGNTPARDLPASAQKTLRIPQGGSVVLRVSVVGEDKVPVDLSAGTVSAHLTIKKSSLNSHATTVVGVKQPTIGAHLIYFTLSANDTKLLDPGRFVYDVWLTRSSERDAIIPLSTLVIEPALRLP